MSKKETVKTVRTLVPVPLSDAEQLDRARKAASLSKKVGKMVFDAKAEAKQRKVEIDEELTELSRLQDAVDTGQEERAVECEVVYNSNDQTVEYYWKNAKVMSREMTEDDRQLKIAT